MRTKAPTRNSRRNSKEDPADELEGSLHPDHDLKLKGINSEHIDKLTQMIDGTKDQTKDDQAPVATRTRSNSKVPVTTDTIDKEDTATSGQKSKSKKKVVTGTEKPSTDDIMDPEKNLTGADLDTWKKDDVLSLIPLVDKTQIIDLGGSELQSPMGKKEYSAGEGLTMRCAAAYYSSLKNIGYSTRALRAIHGVVRTAEKQPVEKNKQLFDDINRLNSADLAWMAHDVGFIIFNPEIVTTLSLNDALDEVECVKLIDGIANSDQDVLGCFNVIGHFLELDRESFGEIPPFFSYWNLIQIYVDMVSEGLEGKEYLELKFDSLYSGAASAFIEPNLGLEGEGSGAKTGETNDEESRSSLSASKRKATDTKKGSAGVKKKRTEKRKDEPSSFAFLKGKDGSDDDIDAEYDIEQPPRTFRSVNAKKTSKRVETSITLEDEESAEEVPAEMYMRDMTMLKAELKELKQGQIKLTQIVESLQEGQRKVQEALTPADALAIIKETNAEIEAMTIPQEAKDIVGPDPKTKAIIAILNKTNFSMSDAKSIFKDVKRILMSGARSLIGRDLKVERLMVSSLRKRIAEILTQTAPGALGLTMKQNKSVGMRG